MVLYVGKKKNTNKTNAHCSRIKTMKRLRNLNKQLMSLPHTNIYWIKSRSNRVKAEDQWWYSYITNKSMVNNKKYWVFQQHNWKVPLETCKRTEVKKKRDVCVNWVQVYEQNTPSSCWTAHIIAIISLKSTLVFWYSWSTTKKKQLTEKYSTALRLSTELCVEHCSFSWPR